MRQLSALVAAGALCACATAPADPVEAAPERIAFERLVWQRSSVALAPDDTAYLMSPVASLATRSRLVVLDRKRAEIRIFARPDGRLEEVVGTPGDGPGQLRKPAAVAALDSGQFVVLDDGRRMLSFRDSLGHVLHEARLPDGAFTSIVPIRAERRIVVAGRIYYGPDSIRFRDLHEFDYSGRHIASYGAQAPTPTLWSRAFATVRVAGAGHELMTATLASNRVRVLDRRTGAERWVTVASGWFTPAEFPSDRLLQHGVTQQSATSRVSAWSHQHRLVNSVFPLGGGRMLTSFESFDPAGQRFFYYALTDRTGTRVVTAPTRVNVLDARGDTLFWITGGGARGSSFVSGLVAPTPPRTRQLASRTR